MCNNNNQSGTAMASEKEMEGKEGGGVLCVMFWRLCTAALLSPASHCTTPCLPACSHPTTAVSAFYAFCHCLPMPVVILLHTALLLHMPACLYYLSFSMLLPTLCADWCGGLLFSPNSSLYHAYLCHALLPTYLLLPYTLLPASYTIYFLLLPFLTTSLHTSGYCTLLLMWKVVVMGEGEQYMWSDGCVVTGDAATTAPATLPAHTPPPLPLLTSCHPLPTPAPPHLPRLHLPTYHRPAYQAV